MVPLNKSKLTAKELLDDICDSLDRDIATITVKLTKPDGVICQTLTQNIKELTNYMRKYYKNKV